MQAAGVSSPWFQAPSPFRTPVTARAVVCSLSITPSGLTVALSRTAGVCMSLKSLADDMLTRSAPGCSGCSCVKTQHTRAQVTEPLTFPQDSVFKDLGEGILENALQVVIQHVHMRKLIL